MDSLAPIVLFVYNRPRHTQLTLTALAKNKLASQSLLYVYADGKKKETDTNDEQNIASTRKIVESIKGFAEVKLHFNDRNKGLSNSIIEGITEVVNRHKKIIVLEDDIIVSPHFLTYMNDGLDIYEEKEEVISIHAYNYPVENNRLPKTFFMRGADCWGWATWKRGWDLFEPDSAKLYQSIISQGLEFEFNRENSYPFSDMLLDEMNRKVNSWAIRWYASAFLNNKYTLYPNMSLIYNTGFDSSGTHSGAVDRFNHKNWNNKKPVNIKSAKIIETNKLALERWKRYFEGLNKPANKKEDRVPLDSHYSLERIYNRIKRQITHGKLM